MKKKSRIRFNPVTKEIEVAGTEKFVKTYFGKLQAMILGAPAKKSGKKPKAEKAVSVKKAKKVAKKKPKVKKVIPTPKAPKAPAEKKVTNIDTVVGLIQGSTEGISTAELKTKTGLNESQIWSIVNRTAKAGKIRKVKRGVYGRVAAPEASSEEKTE
jgi:DNA invertase Pin-like site-specific DNA recombinase